MLRSIFAPAFDASTDSSIFCATAMGAVNPTLTSTRQKNSARIASESFRLERCRAVMALTHAADEAEYANSNRARPGRFCQGFNSVGAPATVKRPSTYEVVAASAV